jgi:hypothetical protein
METLIKSIARRFSITDNGGMTMRSVLKATMKTLAIFLAVIMLCGLGGEIALAGKPVKKDPPPPPDSGDTTSVDCTTYSAAIDTDADGIDDKAECEGLTYNGADVFVDIPGLVDGGDRALRLDPATKDVFIQVNALPASVGTSYIPADPLVLVSADTNPYGSGLPVIVHQMTNLQDPPLNYVIDRGISFQRGAVVNESNLTPYTNPSVDCSGGENTVLGATEVTPLDESLGGIVYTYRIRDHVICTFAEYGIAYSSSTDKEPDNKTYMDDVIADYVHQTIAHEVEHQFYEAPPEVTPRKLNEHFAEGAGYVMDRAMIFNSQTLEFEITVSNHTGSQANVLLKYME